MYLLEGGKGGWGGDVGERGRVGEKGREVGEGRDDCYTYSNRYVQ